MLLMEFNLNNIDELTCEEAKPTLWGLIQYTLKNKISEYMKVISVVIFVLSIVFGVSSFYVTWVYLAPMLTAINNIEWSFVFFLTFSLLGGGFFIWGGIVYRNGGKNEVIYFFIAFFLWGVAVFPVAINAYIKENRQGVSIENKHIVFNSGLTAITTAIKLDILLFMNSKLSTAEVTGHGGDTASAYYIKRRLRQSEISEVIAYGSECNSACTIIWTAVEKRKIRENLYLGFHRSCSIINTCDIRPYLYDGFLSEDLIKVIASPDGEHVCPLGAYEVNLLGQAENPKRTDLMGRIEKVCLNKGKKPSELKTFKGY